MRTKIWQNFDFWLFGVVLLLSIFGIAMIRSAAAGNAEILSSVPRQILFVIAGLAVTIVASIIDYHYWAALTKPIYIATVLLLVVVFIIGEALYGSARWLRTDFFLIQPSEIGKIVLVLVLADFFAQSQNRSHNFRWVGQSLFLTFGIVVWVFLQPNLSTSIVIMVIWFAMIWASGLPPKYLLIFAAAALILALIAFPFLEPYQQGRLLNFFSPDPTARYGDTYNVDQALITTGSGGWFGAGYENGSQVQLRFLKVRHTDFIFSAMAEEFGFVGTSIVITLLFFVVIRCLRAARLARDTFGALIAYGFGTIIFFQAAVNIGVNLRVLPVTGLTLPFISYGGSSLLSLVLGIGLVESVLLRSKALEF